MYQIKCDDYILYDPRHDQLNLIKPTCKLKANAVDEGSFTILKSHPYASKFQRLKSTFEIRQDNHVLFRGRMIEDSRDLYDRFDVDLEGILACTNDTLIKPFSFPTDFTDKADYVSATQNGNVIEYFLRWVISEHNKHAESWQQLKVGTVTVKDPNNYLYRSSSSYTKTWDVLRSKLFESTLGGYLYIRYEDDGNYIDYVDKFELTNTQRITLTDNILNLTNVISANETYSAIVPIGGSEEDPFTLDGYAISSSDSDIVQLGEYLYSKSAVQKYGWICVPIEDSTWTDVATKATLAKRGIDYLSGSATMLSNTLTINALDLHFTNREIQSFRVYRNVLVNIPSHDIVNATYPLTELNIDILNPQNTKITIGVSTRTLIDTNQQELKHVQADIEETKKEVQQQSNDLKNIMLTQYSQIISDCESIILSALESYVETSNFEEFKETVSTQLGIMADEIQMKFTTTTEQINNVDGDLQSKFAQIYKHIKFTSETAISIGSSNSAITLEIDNETGIVFKKNGVQFGLWDGENFYTGNIVVNLNERAQFGNFAFVPRSDGSLSFFKVGDERGS